MGDSTENIQTKRQAFLDHTRTSRDEAEIRNRFLSLKNQLEALFREIMPTKPLTVLDIGCGMGIQSMLWAEDGNKVIALDIDRDLLAIGNEVSNSRGLNIEWMEGSADKLPLANESIDVCLCNELMEHIVTWEESLNQIQRTLRPGGLLLLTTTNVICPMQNEIRLPMYSWWPGFAKRRAEHLARTTKPELANFTDYPAVNWFSYYSLKKALNKRGFEVRDRIDGMFLDGKPLPLVAVISLARRAQLIRAILYLFQRGTVIYAVKRKSPLTRSSV